ncbi:MAG: hypothetical protein Q4P18_04285 [Methanobrevibacter sp.]|uniref:hypothetical protein n=1 Tax=Methanobrevibacter sp. TaxID=66852 RepID=UPI0026DF01E6|nr:hypothetical protein [Methanobrevibacter sp.]MDO5848730.1 hypothetical protein [Methanobrevibacter sp.]
MIESYAFPEDCEFHGVIPHPNAIRIANFEFFWSSTNYLSPFGNETAIFIFEDFVDWLDDNPKGQVIEYIRDILNYWDLSLKDYNESIIEYDHILRLAEDYDFDELVLSVDWSIIAIGFGELIVRGYVDENIKNIIHLAILRQMNSIVLDYFLEDDETFKHLRFIYLTHLLDILEEA